MGLSDETSIAPMNKTESPADVLALHLLAYPYSYLFSSSSNRRYLLTLSSTDKSCKRHKDHAIYASSALASANTSAAARNCFNICSTTEATDLTPIIISVIIKACDGDEELANAIRSSTPDMLQDLLLLIWQPTVNDFEKRCKEVYLHIPEKIEGKKEVKKKAHFDCCSGLKRKSNAVHEPKHKWFPLLFIDAHLHFYNGVPFSKHKELSIKKRQFNQHQVFSKCLRYNIGQFCRNKIKQIFQIEKSESIVSPSSPPLGWKNLTVFSNLKRKFESSMDSPFCPPLNTTNKRCKCDTITVTPDYFQVVIKVEQFEQVLALGDVDPIPTKTDYLKDEVIKEEFKIKVEPSDQTALNFDSNLPCLLSPIVNQSPLMYADNKSNISKIMTAPLDSTISPDEILSDEDWELIKSYYDDMSNKSKLMTFPTDSIMLSDTDKDDNFFISDKDWEWVASDLGY